jgi:hypothetical protein
MRSFHLTVVTALLVSVLTGSRAGAQEDFTKTAQAFRKNGQPVAALADTTLICEAEEFQTDGKGWQAKTFGTNYFAATFANSFMSRKAYLGAPEQGLPTSAKLEVMVPKAGAYLALARYEAPYRFETQFRLVIDQNGKKVLDRLYGSRDNLRIWAFREKLKKEVAWPWGAVENLVWEGHDAVVNLQAGKATLTLLAGKQPEPAARRNVDLIMLTSDQEQLKNRIEKENYLPLDGMLTQEGDVFLKVHNRPGAGELKLTIANGTEHSPYWVHVRNWKPKTVAAKPGESSDWIEVGSLLDTLNDGQWTLTAAGKALHFDLEFGLKNADGKIESLRRFSDLKGNVTFAYDADTRYSRRIRLSEEILYDLVDYLKKHRVEGPAPKRTLIYGYTFDPRPADAKYTAALDEFIKLMGATALGRSSVDNVSGDGLIRGYIDVRSVATDKLEDYCKKLQAENKADKIAVVSLGDEIGLALPPAKDDKGFRAWLQSKQMKPSDVDPAAGNDWDKITYNPAPATAKTNPGLFHWSKIYGYRYGIKQLKDRTDILRKYLPNAGIGANFSPHHSHMYLGDTHHWISVFREGGMTMPWGEDYIWQVPVGSQQMNFIMLDMFRAAIKDKPGAKIHYYVMPHTPGNTTASWRRQFYGDLAHGAKVLNLFEFRPVQAAYTENHCSSPAMYQEVRKSLHELGKFEDIIQDGKLLPAQTGIWCSETADVWDDHKPPFDVAKRTLYIYLRHRQLPIDFVVDGDDLQAYQTLWLCDRHVSRSGSKAIAGWVNAGGRLMATAGAGMYDEFNQPNKELRSLLGVDELALQEAKEVIRFEKQDLPFARPLGKTKLVNGSKEIEVFGVRSVIKLKDANSLAVFPDHSPAVSARIADKGEAYYFTYLPGLAYFKPAMPMKPVDRGATDDSMAHLVPRDLELPTLSPRELGQLPVSCSHALVENTVIQAKQGTVISLINWSGVPQKGLRVVVTVPVPTKQVGLASGAAVKMGMENGRPVFTLDLGVADALILR